jgi:hypothetical protein
MRRRYSPAGIWLGIVAEYVATRMLVIMRWFHQGLRTLQVPLGLTTGEIGADLLDLCKKKSQLVNVVIETIKCDMV